VSQIDAVQNPGDTLLRDFIDSVNEFQSRRSEDVFLQEPVDVEEFCLITRKALTETGEFNSTEIEQVVQFFRKPGAVSLITATPEQRLLVKRVGLPTIEFVQALKDKTIQKSISNTSHPAPVKFYPLKLDHEFYCLLLNHIPNLKDEITDSLLFRLTKQYAGAPIPKSSPLSSSSQKALERIKRNTIKIAQLLQKEPTGPSLLSYSQGTIFPERRVSCKIVAALTRVKGNSNHESLLTPNLRIFNCFRCPPIITSQRGYTVDRRSAIPVHYQSINVYRLQPLTGIPEMWSHYTSTHLGVKHKAGATFASSNCSLLIPCGYCCAEFLRSDSTNILQDHHLFVCCSPCRLVIHNTVFTFRP